MKKINNKIKKYIICILLVILLIVGIIIGLKVIFNDTYTIRKGGKYKLDKKYNCIVVDTSDKIELDINNAKINCDSGPGILVKRAKKVNINLKGKSKIKSKTIEKYNGAIYSKEDLIISGDGTLNIKTNYDGIVSKDGLTIDSGKYVINADDDGIRGKDYVVINNGTFEINTGGDGIRSTNKTSKDKGYILINNGNFKLMSNRDGIQATKDVTIKDGNYDITTLFDNKDFSTKGIKAKEIVTIDGGTYKINSIDDSIHSNKDIKINNGSFNLNTKNDGIHADRLVEINNGNMEIKSYEGIEGSQVKINDGNIKMNTSNDGINTEDKIGEDGLLIEINGGNVVVTVESDSADADAIDSNGNFYMNGGILTINASNPIDYDKDGQYNGGKIIVNGTELKALINQAPAPSRIEFNRQTDTNKNTQRRSPIIRNK